MNRIQGEFESSNKRSTVKYAVLVPEGNPRAVVQIVHGMNEYFGRYEELAAYLCERGFVVCGHDHIGHGYSAANEDDLGFFADSDGDKYVVSDVGLLHDVMRKKYRSLPYILIGHSFGSFVSRAYVASHPDAVDALLLSGTAGQKQPVGMGKFVCKFLMLFGGKHKRSKLVKNICFAGYNKRFEEKTGFEWVTNDPEKLDKYVNDKFCNYIFTLQAFYDMFRLIEYIQSEQWYDDMPKGVPIFVIAGENDPVGNYTKGVETMLEKLRDKGVSDLQYKVYSGERHELYTGLRRQEAFADTAEWINEKIEGIIEARTQDHAFM